MQRPHASTSKSSVPLPSTSTSSPTGSNSTSTLTRSPYFISREIIIPDDSSNLQDDDFSSELVAGASRLAATISKRPPVAPPLARSSDLGSQPSSSGSARVVRTAPNSPMISHPFASSSSTPTTTPTTTNTKPIHTSLPRITKHSPLSEFETLPSTSSSGTNSIHLGRTIVDTKGLSRSIQALDVATPRSTTKIKTKGLDSTLHNLTELGLTGITTNSTTLTTKRSLLRKRGQSKERGENDRFLLVKKESSQSLPVVWASEDSTKRRGEQGEVQRGSSPLLEFEDAEEALDPGEEEEENIAGVGVGVGKGATRWVGTGRRGETYTVDLGGAGLGEEEEDEDDEEGEGEELNEDDESGLTPRPDRGEEIKIENKVEEERRNSDSDVQAFIRASEPPLGYISSETSDGDTEGQSQNESSPELSRSSISPFEQRKGSIGAEKKKTGQGLRLLSVETAPVSTPSPIPSPSVRSHSNGSFSSPNASTNGMANPIQSSADFVVAVVGPRGVGKSTVIRRGLKRPEGKPIILAEDEEENRVTTSTSHFTISGQARSIEVLEIDTKVLEYNSEGVIWPQGLPPCEGAMLCYDSTDPHALEPLSKLLQAFWTRGSDVPLIVLACKANSDPKVNATDPNKAASVCNVYGAGIVSLDGGTEDRGRKMKESFNWMIRTIMDNRGESRRHSTSVSIRTSSRPTSPSNVRRDSTNVTGMGSSAMSRARSSSSAKDSPSAHSNFVDPFSSTPLSNSTPATSEVSHVSVGRSSRGESIGLGLGLSVVEEAPLDPIDRRPSAHDHSLNLRTTSEDPLADGSKANDVPSSLAPRRASSIKSVKDSANRAVTEGPGKAGKPGSLDLFFSREDMIDKFLFASVTGNDEKYVTLFLIVFRRFARPYDVLTKLIERFRFVAGRLKTDPLLSRFAQMKLCGTLSTWFSVYPGDFSSPATLGLLRPFLEELLPSGATWVAHHAVDMLPKLDPATGMTDPDATWALPDKSLDDEQLSPLPVNHGPPPARRPSLGPSFDSTTTGSDMTRSMTDDSLSSHLGVPAGSPSTTGTSPTLPSARGLHGSSSSLRNRTSSSATTLGDGDDASIHTESIRSQQSASSSALRKGMTTLGLSLLDISIALADVPEEHIAMQITRITWEAFADITPRDLIRHVLAPRDPSNPSRALREENTNVQRSISFVNYLANWVASVVLVQPKLKWRVRILEKLIGVAYCLREQENFDALMGVLAGLNLQPLYRMKELKETTWIKLGGDHENAPKRLRSLYRLMANTKSFAAYRLAIASSGASMIPYIGVHLQDITRVNEVKSDMRDGKVNWTKFQKMGESAAVVLDCARLAPSLPIDKAVERCVLDAPLLTEAEQYELSKTYEPLGQTTKSSSRTTGARARLRNLAERSPFFH